MEKPIYLDYHSTTPVDKRVLDEMLPYFTEHFGNPSSIDHKAGNLALKSVNIARNNIAKNIGANSEDIIFTSGATEANNLAILGFARKHKSRGNHIITTQIEHKAVLNACKQLEMEGFKISYLKVNADGEISFKELESLITSKTLLISVMFANNEIGVINSLKSIGAIAKKHEVAFHTDVAQGLSYLDLDVKGMNIDLLSASGHKIYAPKGIGFLYINSRNTNISVEPLMFGGSQERKIRSGTLNVPAIIGMSKALDICVKERQLEAKRLMTLRNMLWEKLSSAVNCKINGSLDSRLPHNLNILFPGVEAKALLNDLNDKLSISAGSACTSSTVDVSHVLKAIGLNEDQCHCSIRIGLGRFTTESEIEFASDEIIASITKLKNFFS